MGDTVLDTVRTLMASHSPPLDALIVPSEDNHQSEYVSARDERRAFVSGFTGSAGLALITANEALLWTDGRYFLQATQQLSDRWKLMRGGEDPPVELWISQNLPSEAMVGIDPWCVSVDNARRYEMAFSSKKQKLVQLSKNLVDEVWKDRPQERFPPVTIQTVEFAGRSVADKLKDLREKLSNLKAFAIVLTALDEVAWLYNVRGNDVDYNPVVQAFAIVTMESSFLYVDDRKLPKEVQDYLLENGIEVRDYSTIASDVSSLASGQLSSSLANKIATASSTGTNGLVDDSTAEYKNEMGKKKHNLICIDPSSFCLALYSKMDSDCVVQQLSPLALAKALKNTIELDGLRKAHIRDGAAVVKFLVWLDGQMQEMYGASGYFHEPDATHKRKYPHAVKLTEVSVSNKLEEFRSKQKHFRGLSFATISSVGPNAAINHYRPVAETCSELDPNSIYLFDSGGQYQDGTTDITRTVHFGKPSDHEKSCYTAVLKGHIALDTVTFPNGTTGFALDVLARIPLWKYGLDYRHGTGHGVGSYLNVHEGPHLISFRPTARNVTLQASMTVTDEPGYYEDGNFGIRLENVLVIKEADTRFNFGDKGYLSFEHITWAPYQRKLMDLSRMTPKEIDWVNSYHSACREVLAPHLSKQEKLWLEKATEPIS